MNTLDQFKTINPGDILTVFGVGFLVGIPAKDAPAGWPMGIARRDDGHLIVVDYWGHRIWRIDNNGILHLLAGNGVPGDSGDGGPCSKAQFDQPHDLRIDKHGNLFISDLGNNKIRRIDSSTGIVTTIAGNGKVGRGGKGGLATNAELDTYCGIAIDSKDNIYISSEWANNILRIDAQTGIIELFAGWDARHHPSETKTSRGMFGPTLSMGGYHGDGGPAKKAGFYHPETNGLDNIVSKKTISINVVGTINCLTAILPRFEKRGKGHIALMSSSAGYRGLPRAYSYTSSRAAIINLAESLRIDLRSKGIKVQLITPGFVDTGLTQKNNFHMPFMVSTAVAARRIIKGLSKSNFEITFPRRLTYILKFLRIMPYPIYYALIRLLIK